MPDLPEAACKQEDPEIFFGVHVCDELCDGPLGCFIAKGETGRFARITRARAICTGCPEREPCLEWALRTDQPYGVWGGTTERERKAIRRRDTSGKYR